MAHSCVLPPWHQPLWEPASPAEDAEPARGCGGLGGGCSHRPPSPHVHLRNPGLLVVSLNTGRPSGQQAPLLLPCLPQAPPLPSAPPSLPSVIGVPPTAAPDPWGLGLGTRQGVPQRQAIAGQGALLTGCEASPLYKGLGRRWPGPRQGTVHWDVSHWLPGWLRICRGQPLGASLPLHRAASKGPWGNSGCSGCLAWPFLAGAQGTLPC